MRHTSRRTGRPPACSKGALPRWIGRAKGRGSVADPGDRRIPNLNFKFHAVCDSEGKPIALCLAEGQMCDHIVAKLLYPVLCQRASVMIGDKGYDSDEYRAALKAKDIAACIPPRRGRIFPADFNKTLYRQRRKIENLFARLRDWRRIQTRNHRCARTFTAAITIAAICAFWIN